jgi:hypothetical protein
VSLNTSIFVANHAVKSCSTGATRSAMGTVNNRSPSGKAIARVAAVPITSHVRAINIAARQYCWTVRVSVRLPSSQGTERTPMTGRAATVARGFNVSNCPRRVHQRYTAAGSTK